MRRTIICIADARPGPRTEECANPLHNWPLPSGYNDAHEQAARRLRTGWSSKRCPDCKLYGWQPGKLRETDVEVLP